MRERVFIGAAFRLPAPRPPVAAAAADDDGASHDVSGDAWDGRSWLLSLSMLSSLTTMTVSSAELLLKELLLRLDAAVIDVLASLLGLVEASAESDACPPLLPAAGAARGTSLAANSRSTIAASSAAVGPMGTTHILAPCSWSFSTVCFRLAAAATAIDIGKQEM